MPFDAAVAATKIAADEAAKLVRELETERRQRIAYFDALDDIAKGRTGG